MIQIIATLVMLGVLIWGINKKLNPVTLLLSISVIALLIWTYVTGKSAIGTAASGSKIFDVFQLITNTTSNRLVGMILTIMSVMGYVGYLNHIKANQLFAILAARPLQKIRNPYILAAIGLIFSGTIIIVLPSPSTAFSLLLSTLVPILFACRVTKPTAASMLVMAGAIIWGPANGILQYAFSIVGKVNISITEFTFKHQAPLILCLFVLYLIIFPLVSKYYDKKEGAKPEEEYAAMQDPKSLGIPMFYALFPLIPLAFVIIFSPLVLKSLTINIVTAQFLSLFIVMIIHTIASKKNLREAFDETQEFYVGFGAYLSRAGFLPIAGGVFASTIALIGGMSIIVNTMTGAGFSYGLMLILSAIVLFVLVFITADSISTLALMLPLLLEVVNKQGGNLIQVLTLSIQGGALGSTISLIMPSTLLIVSVLKVDIITIIKRNVIPAIAGLLVTIAYCLIIF